MAVMMQPREKWTDERLDDLQGEMHRGFADLRSEIGDTKAEIRSLRRETMAGFFVIFAAIVGSNAF